MSLDYQDDNMQPAVSHWLLLKSITKQKMNTDTVFPCHALSYRCAKLWAWKIIFLFSMNWKNVQEMKFYSCYYTASCYVWQAVHNLLIFCILPCSTKCQECCLFPPFLCSKSVTNLRFMSELLLLGLYF